MEALFQFFKKYSPFSKKAERATGEVSKIVSIKKNSELQANFKSSNYEIKKNKSNHLVALTAVVE